MSGYIGTTPVPEGSISRQSFVCQNGQVSFPTTGYLAGGQFVLIHLNGALLKLSDDYTAANGSDIVLTSGAAAGDILEFTSFNSFSVSDTVSAASGGTFNGDVIVSGSNKLGVGTSSPDLTLDVSHGTTAEYVATFQNTADNLELKVGTTTGGLLNIQGANASNNGAYDFSLNADGGKIGVGTSSPDALTHIYSGASGVTNSHSYTKLHVESADHSAIQLSGSSGGEQWIWFADDTSATPVGGITYYHGENYMAFRTNSAERMRINSNGVITQPAQPVFRIECASVANVNASNDRILSGSDYQSSTLVQQGSHFNVSTGRFTAPVDGYYYFNFSNRLDNFGGSYIYFTIFDNGGSVVTRNLTSLSATYQTLHCSSVHQMSANDYVYVRLSVTGDTDINMDSDGSFSGFLVA